MKMDYVVDHFPHALKLHHCTNSRQAPAYGGGWGVLGGFKHPSLGHVFFFFFACLLACQRGRSYTGWPTKNGTVNTVDFSGLCSDQQLSFFTLLDRASFPHYNNTKIIKFG